MVVLTGRLSQPKGLRRKSLKLQRDDGRLSDGNVLVVGSSRVLRRVCLDGTGDEELRPARRRRKRPGSARFEDAFVEKKKKKQQ